MLALKIFWVSPTPIAMCATKAWSNSSACENFKSQHPQWSYSKLIDLS